MINLFKRMLPFGEGDGDGGTETEALEMMKKRINLAKEILRNPDKTHYILVMIPEEMSIMESFRTLKVLDEYGIPLKSIIVNQIMPENRNCEFCMGKREFQQKRLVEIRKRFGEYKIMEIPLFKEEIKGIDILNKLKERLDI